MLCMSGRSMFTQEQQKRIAQRYSEGQNGPALAKEYGCTTATIHNVRRKFGVPARVGGCTPLPTTVAKSQQVIDAYISKGMSAESIAREMGLHSETIRKILKRRGIKSIERRYASGKQHGRWKGGRHIDKASGYAWVRIPHTSPYAAMRSSNGSTQEHRYVMAKALGRVLESYETVHHVNGDKTDNRLKNLQLRRGKHGNGAVYRCRCCGSTDIETVAL